ncbi:ATP-binding cassette domain-containing protein [Kitasatospora sp. NPDC006697]|uniref:ATP-binding cassette domain-containing protein n=1 Tax=Kitasatospora sp. NPDC006697 TaxID=3364020 RepID=UPI003678F3C6
MIQVSGLTKVYRRGRRPALQDLGFEVRPGTVTALLGPEGAGKTVALRLMLELERGGGVTLFDGRTYRRLRRPEREVGVLLPDAHPRSGNPGRSARGHLRMLAAAVGVPARRADDLLEQVRLASVAEHRLRAYSAGMTRRLALAAALLGDPSVLLLDGPTEGLSPSTVEWLHAFLRAFPAGGGSVLLTTRNPREAALLADRVVTLDQGRPVADQPVSEFRRTRLHREVAVRGPQMTRLADLLTAQGAQVRPEGGTGLAVAGLGRTEIGELAYRNGIMLHELADRVVEQPAPRPVRPLTGGTGSTPTVQLRRLSAITVGARHLGGPPLPAQVAEAPPTVELPPVPAPADDVPSAEAAPEEPAVAPQPRGTRAGQHPDLPVARSGLTAPAVELPPPSAPAGEVDHPAHSGAFAAPALLQPAPTLAPIPAPESEPEPAAVPPARPARRGSRVTAFLAPTAGPAPALPPAEPAPTSTPADPQPLTGPDHWNG